MRRALSLAVLLPLLGCSATKAPPQRTPSGFTAPDQLLVDKQTDFAAIVKTRKVETAG